jgi:hypothetical protein
MGQTIKRRRTKKLKPTGVLGGRVDALIRACGWPQKTWRMHFGRAAQNITRIRYHGVRPIRIAEFVVRLRKLEALYAPELQALAQGRIQVHGRVRFDFRPDEEVSRFHRPANLNAWN